MDFTGLGCMDISNYRADKSEFLAYFMLFDNMTNNTADIALSDSWLNEPEIEAHILVEDREKAWYVAIGLVIQWVFSTTYQSGCKTNNGDSRHSALQTKFAEYYHDVLSALVAPKLVMSGIIIKDYDTSGGFKK